MTRTRLSGTKFEGEFEREALRQGLWCKRIRTQQSKFAGVDESADYLLATSSRVFYIELKETTKEVYSLYTMRQKEKAEEVANFKKLFPTTPLGFIVVIHYIQSQSFYYQEILDDIKPRQTVTPTLQIKLKELITILKGD